MDGKVSKEGTQASGEDIGRPKIWKSGVEYRVGKEGLKYSVAKASTRP